MIIMIVLGSGKRKNATVDMIIEDMSTVRERVMNFSNDDSVV